MRLLESFRLEPLGRPNLDPKTGQKNPQDLIGAPHRWNTYFLLRDEARLRKVLGEEKGEV